MQDASRASRISRRVSVHARTTLHRVARSCRAPRSGSRDTVAGSQRSSSHAAQRLPHPRRARLEPVGALARAARTRLRRRCRRDRRRAGRPRTRPRDAPRTASANPCRARGAHLVERTAPLAHEQPGLLLDLARSPASRSASSRVDHAAGRAPVLEAAAPLVAHQQHAGRRLDRAAGHGPFAQRHRRQSRAPSQPRRRAPYRSGTCRTGASPPASHPNLPRRAALVLMFIGIVVGGAARRRDRLRRGRHVVRRHADAGRAAPRDQFPGFTPTRRRAT